MSRYHQAEPPELNLSKIKDVPIAMMVGSCDQLSSKPDYEWLRDQLADTLVYYKEFDLGHCAFLIPKSPAHFAEVIELSKAFNPDYLPRQLYE